MRTSATLLFLTQAINDGDTLLETEDEESIGSALEGKPAALAVGPLRGLGHLPALALLLYTTRLGYSDVGSGVPSGGTQGGFGGDGARSGGVGDLAK